MFQSSAIMVEEEVTLAERVHKAYFGAGFEEGPAEMVFWIERMYEMGLDPRPKLEAMMEDICPVIVADPLGDCSSVHGPALVVWKHKDGNVVLQIMEELQA